jgi:hypothetical protein
MEGIWEPQVAESARDPDEGILHDVLRELTITGDEEREPRHFWGVAKIELLQPSIVRFGLVLHDPVHGGWPFASQ